MNDIDRGAYAPGGERPLAFDARSARGGARAPVPLALVGSATVLVVVVVGLVLAYRGDNRGAGANPRTVGEPVGAMKVAAAAPAVSAADPAASAGVYTAQDVPVAKPTFAPPPEAPAARPAPTSLTVNTVDPAKVRIGAPLDEPAPTAAAKAASASAATAVTPVAVAPPPIRVIPKTMQTATVTTATTTTVAPPAKTPALKTAVVVKAKPEAIETAQTATKIAKAETTTPAAASFKGAGVQIGAFSSRELADKGYADVMALAGKGGHGKAVEPVDHAGKTLFRTTVTGFADRTSAKAFCATLSAKGHSCIVKG